jgi:hypothetical protein
MLEEDGVATAFSGFVSVIVQVVNKTNRVNKTTIAKICSYHPNKVGSLIRNNNSCYRYGYFQLFVFPSLLTDCVALPHLSLAIIIAVIRIYAICNISVTCMKLVLTH